METRNIMKNPDVLHFGCDFNVAMLEVGGTVFERISEDFYKCVKTRDGGLILEGIYSSYFVHSYAKFVPNVVIIEKE